MHILIVIVLCSGATKARSRYGPTKRVWEPGSGARRRYGLNFYIKSYMFPSPRKYRMFSQILLLWNGLHFTLPHRRVKCKIQTPQKLQIYLFLSVDHCWTEEIYDSFCRGGGGGGGGCIFFDEHPLFASIVTTIMQTVFFLSCNYFLNNQIKN